MTQYDLVIIGGGPAGYHAAGLASKGGMKTALFEVEKLGGVCLNEGCIPTKVMLNSSKLLYYANDLGTYGIFANMAGAGPDEHEVGGSIGAGFAISHGAVLARKEKVVRSLEAGVRAGLKAAGVDIIHASAKIESRNLNGFIVSYSTGQGPAEEVAAKHILIATGSSPVIPPIKGSGQAIETGYAITSREALLLPEPPKRLVIVGGGAIGLELADYYNSAGSQVTVVELLDRAAYPLDGEVAKILVKNLQKRGVAFKFGRLVTEISSAGLNDGGGFVTIFQSVGASVTSNPAVSANPAESTTHTASANPAESAIPAVSATTTGPANPSEPSAPETLPADKVLLSVGRRPRISDFGAENIGVLVEKGAVVTDGNMRTNIPGVFAAGDVNGKSMLAHTAYMEAGCAVSYMLGKPHIMRYDAIPSIIYTNPEAACVGESEESAAKKGIKTKTVKILLRYSGRYVAEVEGGDGICKVLFDARKGTVAGVHIVGQYASEIILSAAFMVGSKLPVETLKGMAFPHPTVGEVLRDALYEF